MFRASGRDRGQQNCPAYAAVADAVQPRWWSSAILYRSTPDHMYIGTYVTARARGSRYCLAARKFSMAVITNAVTLVSSKAAFTRS